MLRSGIDLILVIFAFRQPDLLSNSIDGNTFGHFSYINLLTLFNFDHMYSDP